MLVPLSRCALLLISFQNKIFLHHFNMRALIILEYEKIFSGSDCVSNVMVQTKREPHLTLMQP